MKKIMGFCFVLAGAAFFLASSLHAEGDRRPSQLNPRYDATSYQDMHRNYTLRVTSAGDIVGDYYGVNQLGDTSIPWGGINVSSGLLNVHQYFSDLPASSTSVYKNNGFTISTAIFASQGGTTYISSDFTRQGDYPRNFVLISTYTADITTRAFAGTATIIGTNALGFAQTETLSFSTGSYSGVKAWTSISSVTIAVSTFQVTGPGITPIFYFGTGNKIGLSNWIKNSDSVYKVVESGSNVATSAITVDATNQTVTFSATPNAAIDFNIWYHANASPRTAVQP
jgi:hypothetical protein